MALFKTKKLNAWGMAHTVVLVAVVVLSGIAGSLYLYTTHADSITCGQKYANLVYGGSRGHGHAYLKNNFCMVWNSNRLVFQGDGNLVLYHSSSAVWSTYGYTYGKVSSTGTIELQQDGNMVIYDKAGSGRRALWASGTSRGTSTYYYYQTWIDSAGKIYIEGMANAGNTILWHKP